MCSAHYQRFMKHGDVMEHEPVRDTSRAGECSADACEKAAHSRGYCSKHYWRLRKYGTPELPTNNVKAEPTSWVSRYGYRILYLPEHPMANSSGAIPEHRLVMSEAIGRDLRPEENVHHINGDRLDNRLENLELWSKAQPAGQRVDDKVSWAIEILNLYRPEALALKLPAD